MDRRELFDDFQRALGQLHDALGIPAENNVIKAGCIQYFEFTFELAWKTIKRVAEDEGVAECNSPKSALKAAFSNGWINDEEIWLSMLSSRNKMSHTYNAEDALEVFDQLAGYVGALRKMAGKIEKLLG